MNQMNSLSLSFNYKVTTYKLNINVSVINEVVMFIKIIIHANSDYLT